MHSPFNGSPVRLDGVIRRYRSGSDDIDAVCDINLEVKAGEMVALVGPSGCGKSTLLNLIGCVDLATAGSVFINGVATASLSDDELTKLRRVAVGTVFQAFNLLPGLSLAENIALPLILLGRTQAEIRTKLAAGLTRVGLAERAAALPSEVSGGQQQRAAILRAVIHQPAIVLADEPTGNLDSSNGVIVLDLLREFADNGQAIIMATHSTEAAARCDRIISMRDGRIVGGL